MIESTHTSTNYLYVIHSKHYDIDGPDNLYKFGCTNDISRRKFDNCYTTAFRYECTYKCYWELRDKDCYKVEFVIKQRLKTHRNDTFKGTEIYSIRLSELVNIVELYLKEIECDYVRCDIDKFTTKPNNSRSKAIDDLHRINAEANNKNTKDLDSYLKNVWECDWVDLTLVPPDTKRCYDCNKLLYKYATAFKHHKGIRYLGSECAKEHMSNGYLYTRNEYKVGKNNRLDDDTIKTMIVTDTDRHLLKYDNPYAESIRAYADGSITREGYWDRLELLERSLNIHYRVSFHRAEAIAYYVYNHDESPTIDAFKRKIDRVSESLTPGCKMGDIFHYGITCNAIVSFFIENNSIWSVRYKKAVQSICDWFDHRQDVPLDNKKISSVRESTVEGGHVDECFNFNKIINSNNKQKTKLQDPSKINELLRRGIGMITGGPGAGKSTFIAHGLVPFLQLNGYYIQCISPTAIASIRLCDKIKRAGEENPGIIDRTRVINDPYNTQYEPCAYTIHKAQAPRYTHLFKQLKTAYIIDEVSMLNVLLLSDFLRSMKHDNAIIIFAGDTEQLPPVGGGPAYKIIESRTPVINLLGNNRVDTVSGGDKLNDMLCKSRNKDFPVDEIKASSSLRRGDIGYSYVYRTHQHTNIADIVKNVLSEWKVTDITSFNKEEDTKVILAHRRCIIHNINKEVRKALGLHNKYNIGDRVIFTKNDPSGRYYNGIVGTIKEVTRKNMDEYDIFVHDPIRDEYIDISGDELQHIDFAYALTVHKAQGGGYTRVCYIRDSRLTKCSALDYTAITRVKNHLLVYDITSPEQQVVAQQRPDLLQLISMYIEKSNQKYRGIFTTVHSSINNGKKMSPNQAKYITEGLKTTYAKFDQSTTDMIKQFTY